VSWPMVKLGDIFEIARGGSPRPIDDFITDSDDGLNWISIKDASNSNKYINSTKLKIKPEGLSKTRMVHPGDFLLTNSMSFGRPYIMNTTGCIHDGWLVLSGNPEMVDSDYFYYLLGSETLKQRFTELAAGAVVKNLNTELVKSVEVPLPPLAEQKRIAAILDKADAIRRKRQQAIQLADDFLRAVFLEMFGDPVTNPKGWEMKPLGTIFKLSSGQGLTAKEMDKSGTYPVYGGNGINGYHTEYMFDEPQLIIGRVGVYCGVVHITEKKSWVTDNALYVKEYSADVNVDYLAQLLTMANLNQYAGKAAQPLVSGSRIYPLEMIFPPIEEQIKFSIVKEFFVEQVKKTTDSEKSKAALFESLSQKAFSGKL